MSAIISKALRAEVLALAEGKREGTVASVKKMYSKHAKKAVSRRHRKLEQEDVVRIEGRVREIAL
ncbi:hypothetical protein [Rhizobium leguminosarum]|uniref:hypothetical protein n=1 Tax=Rhizobium TaxID=379 RepID=UPI001030F453|nr:hypothetical protein [Rhizobium leguminosarum]QIO53905.1 hypothetical protein HA461_23225 [Rhizobium leguminosarum bv. trifolii]TBH13936.1 hypothetical protein ELG68_23640 [Rhizobium leguminosarum]